MLHNIIDSTKPDAIMATETCLDPPRTDNQISPNYHLWHNYRNSGIDVGRNDTTPQPSTYDCSQEPLSPFIRSLSGINLQTLREMTGCLGVC